MELPGNYVNWESGNVNSNEDFGNVNWESGNVNSTQDFGNVNWECREVNANSGGNNSNTNPGLLPTPDKVSLFLQPVKSAC